MNQWLPSSGRQWVVPAVILVILIGVAVSYATASATARALQIQLDSALVQIQVTETAEQIQRERSDSLIAQQDSNEERTDSVLAVVRDSVVVAVVSTDVAIAEARVAAAGLPIVQLALDRVTMELEAERMAHEVSRATSAAEIFAGQQRERVLGDQLLNERQAADDKDVEQDRALSISMQESEAWERAAKPGALTQIWKQGRWAALAVVVVVATR